MKFLTALPFVLLPIAAIGQSGELPAYAYDMVADITMATTAAETCGGVDIDDWNLQNTMVEMMGRLVADGLDPVASVQQLVTDAGQAQIALRETALRTRHGVAAEGAQALCDAIRAEVAINRVLAKMVKLR